MPKLSSIYGQEPALRALRHALETDSLSGTYLFAGPEGSGKSTLALAFAQAAACAKPVHHPFDACGDCESCSRLETGAHSEIVTIRPAGEQLQIWQLWDRQGRPPGALSRTLSYAPILGKRRVTILEQVDRLTEGAANSLLKVLEEPPPYALFVLLAPHPARVLPTILSRSQIIRVRAVEADALAAYLKETMRIDEGRAAMLAAYSEGRIGQAMTLASGPAIADEIARILDYAAGLPAAPPHRALKAAEQFRKVAGQTKALLGEEPADTPDTAGEETETGVKKDKTARKQFAAVIDLLVTFYRDLLAVSAGALQAALVHQDRRGELCRLAALGSADRWAGCLDALLLARRRLDANANVTLVSEILLMKLLATV